MKITRDGFHSSLLTAVCLVSASLVGQVNVTTVRNDNARTGQNTQETILTLANVNAGQFGKVFSAPVDGYVYAQPLYLANVQNITGSTHNVLYVATQHDSVYAIDADNGTVLWQQSLINPSAGITTVPTGDVSCPDIVPEIGITSTPVIDTTTGTIYLVARTKENGTYHQRLHALDIVTHAEKFGGPQEIAATFQSRTFDPLKQNNRAGLLLENGHLVLAWGSHCDNPTYQGWVISYNAATLAQEAVFNTEPDPTDGSQAGVWMAGDGIAADSDGNLFFATGNGDYNSAAGDYGDSIMKLSVPSAGAFTIADWFTPFNQGSLDGGDTDLGSGGLVLLPDLPPGSAHPHLLVQMGKEGTIYLIDRDNMGKFCVTCIGHDSQIVQEIPHATTGIWGSPAYWNGSVYWGGGKDAGNAEYLTVWSVNANNSGLLSTSPTSKSANSFAFPTASPVISSNGSTNGILWILDNSSFASSCCQILYAYDATNLGNMLYNSNQAPGSRDVPGGAVKFTAPTVANGRVYVGSQGTVTASGIISTLPTASMPKFLPPPGSYSGSVNVTLSDDTPSSTVHCTTDGSVPDSNSPVCSTVVLNSPTRLQAMAVAPGYNDSLAASAPYNVITAAVKPTTLAFGNVVIGSTSTGRKITLTNSGAGTLVLSSIAASGGYAQTNNCLSSLPPGSNCLITVNLTPPTSGWVLGAISIYTNAPESPQVVPLSGIGIFPVSLTPASLNFGTVPMGTTSTPLTATAKNNSSSAASLSYSASSAFAVAPGAGNGCGLSLAPNSSCTLAVTFTPGQKGTAGGSAVLSGPSFATQHTNLTGSGSGAAPPTLSFAPASLSFGIQGAGVSGKPKTVTLTNKGTASVMLNSLTASTGYSVTPSGALPCSGQLAAGAKCTFSVGFTPPIMGIILGAVTVANTGPVNPVMYNLTGTGVPAVTFSPPNLTFSGQRLGTTSPLQTLTLSNNQTVPLNLSSVVPSGDYAVVPGGAAACGFSVPANSKCTLQVTFTPTQMGTIKGAVTFTHDAGGSPQSVPLTGTGQ